MSSTPARGTRSRSRQPLPVTGTAISTAYGSRGRANIDNQIEDHEEDFATALGARQQASRANSAARTSRENSAESRKKSPEKTARRARPQPILEEEEEEEEQDEEPQALATTPPPQRLAPLNRRANTMPPQLRAPQNLRADNMRPASGHGTAIDQVAAYDAVLPIRRRHQSSSSSAVSSRRSSESPVPSDFTVFVYTLLKLLVQLKNLVASSPLLLVLLFVSAAATVFFSVDKIPLVGLEETRQRVIRGARIAGGLPVQGEPAPAVDFSLLDSLESRVAAVLPRMVVVDVDDNNRLHVTDDLYDALQGRLREDESIWADWLERNLESVHRLVGQQVADQVKQQKVVSAATALEMIKKENSNLEDLLEQKTADFREEIVSTVHEELAKNFGGGGDYGLHKLRISLYIQNMISELNNFNVFAPRAGARIDRSHTSPTWQAKQKNPVTQWLAKYLVRQNGPQVALLPFDSWGQSWCSSPADGEVTQLGIRTELNVIPREFVIGHIPKGGTRNIDTAPKVVELWTNLRNPLLVSNTEAKIANRSNRARVRGECGSKPEAKNGEHWVCLGRGEYNVDAVNHMQTMPLFLEDAPASNHFVVTVRSNHGADATCLYQVKLHGREIGSRAV